MFNAEFLYFECPGAAHAHCASIVAGPDNSLIAAWYVYPEDETKHAQLVLARKEARRADWTLGKPIDLGLISSLGNPVLFFDPEGTLWLHFVSLKSGYWDSAQWCSARSDDLGRTFASTNTISKEEGLMVRHGPVVLDSGKALFPVYSDRTKTSYLYESEAPYESWRRAYAFGDDPVIQGSLLRYGERLVSFFRPAEGPRHTWRSTSADDGRTWGAPVRLPLPNPLSGISGIALNGRIGLVFNNTLEHRRYPLSISWSEDNLHNWTTPVDLDQPGFEVSYPSFIVDENAVVHGVYTYNRKFIKYVSFDEAWIEKHRGKD